jgi:hypothetical protein
MVSTTTYMEPIWLPVALVISTIGYGAAVLGSIYRLSKRHRTVWESMGRPWEFPPQSSQTFVERWSAMWRSLIFVLFSGSYSALNDRSLTLLIFLARVLFVVVLLSWTLAKAIGHQITVVRQL